MGLGDAYQESTDTALRVMAARLVTTPPTEESHAIELIAISLFFILLALCAIIAKKRFSTINTPVKRLGFSITVLGIFMLGIGMYRMQGQCFSCAWSTLGDDWWARVTNYVGYGWDVAWGTHLTAIGLLLSYFYDFTIGRFVRWIRTG